METRHSSEEIDAQDIVLNEDVAVIRDIYLVKKWLGNGKFGSVYQAVDITDDQLVAIKMEKADAEYSSIKHEVRIMSYLFRHRFRQLPDVHWYGKQSGFIHMVMCYYERNLDQLDTLSHHQMRQCLQILKIIHGLFVIHRDIKPQNFMLKGDKIHLIDYGLATFYVGDDGEHVPNKKQDTITGTPKFVSYYNHVGQLPSRRDDLISLGYLFFYMLNRKFLPWSSPHSDVSQKSYAIRVTQMKSWENISILSRGGDKEGSDNFLHAFMNHCYHLDYSAAPDYDYLSTLFG